MLWNERKPASSLALYSGVTFGASQTSELPSCHAFTSPRDQHGEGSSMAADAKGIRGAVSHLILLTRDEARRIAANIAKLGLLQR
jgi:hypothetical protein